MLREISTPGDTLGIAAGDNLGELLGNEVINKASQAATADFYVEIYLLHLNIGLRHIDCVYPQRRI